MMNTNEWCSTIRYQLGVINLVKDILLPLFFIIGMVYQGHSQSFSWESIDTSFEGSIVLGVFEVEDRAIVAISNGTYFGNNDDALRQVVFYQLHIDGSEGIQLIEEHVLTFSEKYDTYALQFITETQEWLLVQAKFSDFSEAMYRIQVYSSEFALVEQDSVFTHGVPQYFHIDTYNGRTIVLGSFLPPPSVELFYATYDHLSKDILTPIFIGQTEPQNTFFITSVEFDEFTGNMLVFYYGGIAELDSTLFQIRNFDFQYSLGTSDHGQVSRVGDYYFSHGAWSIPPETARRNIVFNKYNLNFHRIRADTLGRKGTDNYPFVNHSMDFRNHQFLLGGHLDGPIENFPFEYSVKKFYLAKYDDDVELIWFKEYGGDRAYIMLGTHLLEDGGGLAYGYVTDTISRIRYAYIMYVNENGDIVSSQEIPSSPGPPLTVVNPGDDQLIILNPDGLDARIVLYTLDGKTVLHTPVLPDMTSHDLSIWPPGMYPYVFYLDDKPVKSGKWVKKE